MRDRQQIQPVLHPSRVGLKNCRKMMLEEPACWNMATSWVRRAGGFVQVGLSPGASGSQMRTHDTQSQNASICAHRGRYPTAGRIQRRACKGDPIQIRLTKPRTTSSAVIAKAKSASGTAPIEFLRSAITGPTAWTDCAASSPAVAVYRS